MSPTATALAARIRAGTTSATAVVTACLDRIARFNPHLNALLFIDHEGALAQAAAVDQAVAAKHPLGPLAGVPVVVKDNICVRGQVTTCGSKMLAAYRPPYDAFVVERLREAGAVIVGKANMDEFAMGSSCENSAFGPVQNPRAPGRVPGGSSGGSAAAVAAGFAPLALGSDTGGSIRQPASHCGVVGMKPTYGRVSRFGLVAFGSSLDQIGPFARTVADVRLLLNVISPPDPRDGTHAGKPAVVAEAASRTDLKGVTAGVPREYIVEGIDPAVRAVFDRARETLAVAGAKIVDVSLPRTEYGVAVYYIIACAEAASNLARFDGAHYGHRAKEYTDIISMFANSRAEGFGDEVKRRILLGTHVLSSGYYDAYYNKALKVRALLKEDFDRAFRECDMIVCPVAPTPAFKLGAFTDDPLRMYLSDIYTISVNLAGLPGLAVPAGTAPGGLPVGLQFIGPAWSDAALLDAGAVFEARRGFEVTAVDPGEAV
ncbi:MAG: Asp-tRNA(Asn)/Glu-tRNA(Gln) amidotransferase subunit GatA [Planctomycetota bacterium]